MLKDKSLKGKRRKEMDLKEFDEVDSRSTVMLVEATITHKIIVNLIGVTNT